MQNDLISLREALSLLARPSRGKKQHTSTMYKWARRGAFQIHHVNGAKVCRREFLAWARRTHRLYTPHVPHFREYRIDQRAHELAMINLRLRGIAT